MNHIEFGAAMDRLGLSPKAAGELIGVDTRTIHRWMNGEWTLPIRTGRHVGLIEKVGVEEAFKLVEGENHETSKPDPQ
jgi:hypothetical protein